MLFNSIHFLAFFPLVTTVYFILPHAFRWLWLLGASCYFYMAFIPQYILILSVTIVVDYLAGIWMERTHESVRRMLLICSVISTCCVLFIFKYFNFATAQLNALAQFIGWNYSIDALALALPVGLSFHTFQSLSYVVEVYRRRQPPETHFGIYALYVMFYPQLVAGPIERPQNLLHQFRTPHRFNYESLRGGLMLMLYGFFKKLVVADRLAIYVDTVYGNPLQHTGTTLAVATFFFAFQIYADFSGYSDIACGAAKVMGFDLMLNFDRPYFAKSVAEFWRRWHISLSTWFRDYVYLPLGGNQGGPWRWAYNLTMTFLISGLWHGANWTYVVWGGLNAMYMIGGSLVKGAGLSRIPNVVKAAVTFLLICISWVFFRASSLNDAFFALHHMLTNHGPIFIGETRHFLHAIVALLLLLGFDYWTRGRRVDEFVGSQALLVRWSCYLALIFAILALGVFDASQFIYFQF